MDNPQHYQPLSHALHPPLAATSQAKSAYSMYNSNSNVAPTTSHREEEEEEEEEEEDDDEDEGLVEEQLHENEPDNIHSGTPDSRPG